MMKQQRILKEREYMEDDRIVPEASATFVDTPYVSDIAERALTYLRAGYPVHFAGPSGTGKTTLAFHLAAMWGRDVTLMQGNEEFVSSDLTGKDVGYRKSKLVDNFITSVLKTEEEMSRVWVDNRLTTACRKGDTLIYDEFNRSLPETNNVLLSVLSEGILNLPGLRGSGDGFMDVHPGFRAIFTSNPEEYAGTHKTQDALMDRMITIQLGHPDRDTELKILHARSGLPEKEAAYIVDIVRELRGKENKTRPSLRSGIAIAKILNQQGLLPRSGDKFFQAVCWDTLSMEAAKVQHAGKSVFHEMVNEVIRKVCPPVGGDAFQAANTKKMKLVG
jgi:nitric oxide reductase NorQ protein